MAVVLDGHYRSGDPHRPLIPASLVKLVTALLALEELGPDYRFHTDYYLDGTTLAVKGWGDPFLVSESLAGLDRLLPTPLPRLSRIVIDQSAFQLTQQYNGTSTNPYDAPVAPLVVNFNTVAVCRRHGRLVSGEPQTPTLPLMAEVGRVLAEGACDRLNAGAAPATAVRYAGELMAAFLGPAAADAKIEPGRVPDHRPPTAVLRSRHTVAETVAAMLRYSNNVMANQLFLASGAHRYGWPATWEKSRRAARRLLASLGIGGDACRIVEGSGLARDNRCTAQALITVLHALAPHRDLLPEIDGVRRKSGTLSGVYNYAGYLEVAGRATPFVIMVNGPENRRDELLGRLRRLAGGAQ